MLYTFIIQGNPTPLARPRFCEGHVYDSQVEQKEIMGWEMRTQSKHWGIVGFGNEPIKMTLEFGMRMPKLSAKKKSELVNRPHTKRPDLSNLIKFIEDAALGILYKDDSIIAEISAKKIYVEEPYTKMVIEIL